LLSFTFRNRDFSKGYGGKKWKKCLPIAIRLRVAFSTFNALLVSSIDRPQPRIRSCANIIIDFSFPQIKSRSYSAGCWSITLPARGCFPVAAALDAAIRVSALTPV
jgi:hypothetical protein